MHIEVRRSKKTQGRWWVIALDGREIYRESTAKGARRFAKTVSKTEDTFWLMPETRET